MSAQGTVEGGTHGRHGGLGLLSPPSENYTREKESKSIFTT